MNVVLIKRAELADLCVSTTQEAARYISPSLPLRQRASLCPGGAISRGEQGVLSPWLIQCLASLLALPARCGLCCDDEV